MANLANLPRSARTEFTAALNQICAERGISPEAVIDTIKAALVAAYKKDFNIEEEAAYEAELDQVTGEAKLFELPVDDKGKRKEVTPPGFGRIAAQTAKQVILQKIREAENYFGKKIFIIAEPKELRINNPNNKIEGGYLIVGYDSEAIKDCLWLIESFKTSALKIKPKSSTLEKTEQTATAKRDRTKVEADEARDNL